MLGCLRANLDYAGLSWAVSRPCCGYLGSIFGRIGVVRAIKCRFCHADCVVRAIKCGFCHMAWGVWAIKCGFCHADWRATK
jgi:hypothetical protein